MRDGERGQESAVHVRSRSKEAAGRDKDRLTLPTLRALLERLKPRST